MALGVDLQVRHSELPHGTGHPEFDLAPLDRLMQQLATFVRDTWIGAVSGTVLPGMTKAVNDDKYAAAITVEKHGDFHYGVVVNYPEAERIEQGTPAYDMKPMLLASPRAKPTKDGGGTYITIPMRQFTAGKGGQPRVSANPSGANTMPPDVHQYTKAFGHYEGGAPAEGSRTKIPLLSYNGQEVGGVNLEALSRGLPAPMAGPYTWKAGQYQGLTNTRTAGGASRYYTFRRISTLRLVQLPDGRAHWAGSDPNSWISPGKPANPISQAVEQFTAPEISKALNRLLAPV